RNVTGVQTCALPISMPDPLVELGDGHAIVAARIGGVVHEHVDAPKGSHDAIDEILDCRGTTHVADPGQRAVPALADLLRGALDEIGRASCRERVEKR